MIDLNIIAYILLGFYLGVYCSEKMELKFKTITFPITVFWGWVSKLINKTNNKDEENNKEENIKGKL